MKVVAVAKEKSNQNIIAFKLDDGTILNYEDCINAINAGQLPELMLGRARDGSITIKGVADGDPSNNLQNLPIFELK